MDAILVIKKIIENKKLDRKEKFVSESDNNVLIVGIILAIFIGIYAGYLSYECSSKHEEPIILKLLYTVLAFIFGLFYLLYYFLLKHKC
jgi:uncharacterized BrkB/YihY/UPF0761 family membrane protein